MLLALDVFYLQDHAKAVGVLFNGQKSEPEKVIIEFIKDVYEYIPGEFYKRELPCIKAVLDIVNLKELSAIIVDGHIYIDNEKNMGLGAHVWHLLGGTIPIIGVAKNAFFNNKQTVYELKRGNSNKPLFISSIGIELNAAVQLINEMHGNYRMPTILKELDRITKLVE